MPWHRGSPPGYSCARCHPMGLALPCFPSPRLASSGDKRSLEKRPVRWEGIMGIPAPSSISLQSPLCLSQCNKGFMICILPHSKGSQPHGSHPSHPGALLPSSHSSGQHPAVQITGGCEQLRLKIGPNTSMKTSLLPKLAMQQLGCKKDDPRTEAKSRTGGGSQGTAPPATKEQTPHGAISQHRSPKGPLPEQLRL